jgi:peptidoglycan/LPS O-acetylase OafA/YrhL
VVGLLSAQIYGWYRGRGGMGAIRLFLALSVVVWHLYFPTRQLTANGYIAVLLFFIISGFYMSMVMNEKYVRLPVLTFYRSRVLRLYPAYLAVVAVAILFSYHSGKKIPTPDNVKDWISLVVTNGTLLTNPLLPKNDLNLVISPAWSLAIELQFYIAVPFILTRRLWIALYNLAICLPTIIMVLLYAWWRWVTASDYSSATREPNELSASQPLQFFRSSHTPAIYPSYGMWTPQCFGYSTWPLPCRSLLFLPSPRLPR